MATSYVEIALKVVVREDQVEALLGGFKILAGELRTDPDLPADARRTIRITKEAV